MKKILLGSSFALLALVVLSSCKKDYTCACTVNGSTLNLEFENQKKADAESACEDAETTYKMGDPNASCSI